MLNIYLKENKCLKYQNNWSIIFKKHREQKRKYIYIDIKNNKLPKKFGERYFTPNINKRFLNFVSWERQHPLKEKHWFGTSLNLNVTNRLLTVAQNGSSHI